MKNQSVFTISFVLTFFIYALILSSEQYIVFGEENSSSNSISERIILPYTIQTTTTTTTAVQPDGESHEKEPITDLPVIDTPCKSPCPPTAEMCIFMCK